MWEACGCSFSGCQEAGWQWLQYQQRKFSLLYLLRLCGVNCGRGTQSGVTATMRLSCRLSINGRYARDPLLAHMLRCLIFICARHQFSIVAKHTSGKDNVAADAISRNNMQMFYLQVPNASSSPTPVPPLAVIALTSSQIDWLSQDWTNLFSFILSRP